MKELNAELSALLHDLAELIGRKLSYESFDLQGVAKPLIQALVRDGFSRISDANLQVRLEAQVLKDFADVAIHRRREISAMAGKLQETLDELVKWQTSQPRDSKSSGNANISSATDS